VFGHRHRRRDQFRLRRDTVEEAELMKPLGGKAKAERHFHRDRIWHVGEVAVIVAAKQPALCLRHFEHGLRHRDPQIGALNQHEAAAHGETVDRSDHRLFQRAVHEGIGNLQTRAARHAGRQRLLHVLAGAEAAAGAGKDRDLELLVVPEFGPRLRERLAHLGVERIQPLGPVHAHDQNLSLPLGFDDSHEILRPISDERP
jgi:hypothetical protein